MSLLQDDPRGIFYGKLGLFRFPATYVSLDESVAMMDEEKKL